MDYLDQEQQTFLRETLEGQRDQLLRTARRTVSEQFDNRDTVPSDTIDLSSDESMQVTEHRLRDREKFLIGKISKALKRIESGDYGYCKECDSEIGFLRLKARPVAELCIDCKEEQERAEKGVAEKRQRSDARTMFK